MPLTCARSVAGQSNILEGENSKKSVKDSLLLTCPCFALSVRGRDVKTGPGSPPPSGEQDCQIPKKNHHTFRLRNCIWN